MRLDQRYVMNWDENMLASQMIQWKAMQLILIHVKHFFNLSMRCLMMQIVIVMIVIKGIVIIFQHFCKWD